jgi:putative peptidoglycan lipid II flippase
MRARRFAGGVGRDVIGATVAVALATLFVKFFSVAKDLLIASRFGRSDPLEAYLNAFVIPSLLAGIFSTGMNSAFIASYVHAKTANGVDRANALASGITGLALVFTIVLSCILWVASDWVLAPLSTGFSPEKVALLHRLFLIMLPIVVAGSFSTIWAAVLNTAGKFTAVALAPLTVPLATAIAVYFWSGGLNATGVAVGTMLGFVLQAVTVGVLAAREGIPIVPRWAGWSPEVRDIVRLFIPAVMAALLMSSATAVDQSMAAMLPAGSVAAFNYGTKLIILATNLGATSLSTALLPKLSRLVARGDWKATRRLVRNYSLIVLLASIPVAIGIYAFSGELVQLIYQRGTFNASDAAIVARVQSFLAFEIPVYALGMIFVTLITALRRVSVFVLGNVINVVCNVSFNWLLMRVYGVAGIALSTSAMYFVSTAFLGFAAYRFLREAESGSSLGAPATS